MSSAAFTLTEVMMSLSILTVVFAGVVGTYVQTSYRAEWSGYSLAAQALSIQQLEQAKSAVWDTRSYPVKNELTNIAAVSAAVLDIPISGTNLVWATNYVTIAPLNLSTNPPVTVYFVRVDTVWPFRWRKTTRYHTNSVANYMAPD